jgi:hypothetical protein
VVSVVVVAIELQE